MPINSPPHSAYFSRARRPPPLRRPHLPPCGRCRPSCRNIRGAGPLRDRGRVRGALARCSLKLVPVSSYLALFALEIIDLGFHLRHLTLQISHVVVHLLYLERQITRPMLDVITIGLLLQGLLDLLYVLPGFLDLL